MKIPRVPLSMGGRPELPVILQSENTECGLACIAMVSSAFGHREDLVSMRRRFPTGERGATLAGLMRTASALCLAPRALRLETGELKGLACPAILHWDFNHFVVLKRVNRRSIDVHDPAVGVRRYPLPEVGKHFTGVALELTPAEGFEKADKRERPPLTSWFSGIDAVLPALGQILVLSGLLQLVTLATPFYMQLVVDEVLVKHDADLLVLLGAGFFGLTIFSVLTRALRGFFGIYLTHQLSYHFGARLFRHLLSLPVTWFTRRQMGDIVSRFGSQRPIQEFLTSSTITVLLDGIMAVTTLTMLFLYSPLLASIVLATVLLYLLAQLVFYLPVKLRNFEQIVADARSDSHFMETIRSISAIKRFGAEPVRHNDWLNRFTDAVNARVRSSRLSLCVDLIESALSGTSHVLVVFLGARSVLSGDMSIGMLYAFLAWRSHMTSATTSLVNEYIRFLMLSLHLERLADIQSAAPEPGGESALVFPIEGGLELVDATFRYAPDDPVILDNVGVRVAAGEALAIFGPSGCGKSTLLSILAGMQSPSAGELLVDGHPISVIGVQSLREQTASVMQGDVLLSGSIASN
ncbi:MAG: peptidase domain-containing ABC transporter, partial [Pseudomonadales bacterium]|nr:peptidase domain-containing ABC transporter [Pseudomonadales bacterium]